MALVGTTTIFDLIDDRDLVIEAIVKKVEVKTALLKRLHGICQHGAILASHTLSISITELFAA